jgi:hypothetical protein
MHKNKKFMALLQAGSKPSFLALFDSQQTRSKPYWAHGGPVKMHGSGQQGMSSFCS